MLAKRPGAAAMVRLNTRHDRMHQRAARWFLGLCLIVFPFAALAATKTWDGGGAGNNCSTVANWSGDTKPTAADDVVLDGTSTKDLTWDSGCPTGVRSWSQNSGYTGTASFSITNFTLTGGLTLAAGTLTAPSGTLTIRGTITKTGGTFTHNNGTVLLAGTGAYTLEPGGTSFNTLTLNTGLVGYWKFDDGSGNKARDDSGNGNVGTLTSMSTGNGGPSGWTGSTTNKIRFYDPYALKFDGVNDYVSVGNMSSYFSAQEATFTAWVKRNRHTPAGPSTTGSWFFNLSNANNHYVWTDGNIYDGTFKTARTTVGAGIVSDRTQWHHVAITRKAGANGWKFYQNATEIASDDGGTWEMATSIKIGNSSDSQYNFDGQIDDVRIYNRALSASEVATLYNGSKSTGSGVYQLGSALHVNGNLNVISGTLDSNGNDITAAANVSIQGDFTKGSRTFTLDGTVNQTISGSTVFWNVTKTVTSASTLFLDFTSRQSVSGALTLQGAAGNLLSLRVTRAGSGARLLLDGDAGTQSLTYLDAKDSNASGGAALSCLNCTDSANNTNWQFVTGGTNFLSPDTFNSGGGEVAKSNNYRLTDSIGEPVIGFGSTANYKLESGYRHSESAQGILSFSCSSTVNLGSVVGTGQKTGSGSCTVVTDVAAGYNLSWAVLSGSGGVSTGSLISEYNDVIAPFVPSVADMPNTWSVAASSAAWGARLSSRSTDTAGEWGTDGSSDKWLNVATVARSIISRATPTSGGGSTEIMQFRAEVGPSSFKPTGTYRSTVTLTAVTL